MFSWRPNAGQVALIEVAGGDECLTGVVLDDDGAESRPVAVDLGASPRTPDGECEVVASFFAPDALYRLRATAVHRDGSADRVIDLRVHDVERVQRRQSPRALVELRAVLSNLDEPGAMASVVGTTVDVGDGGCRVRTTEAFPSGSDPTVSLALPDGSHVVALGAVVQSQTAGDGYEYRIVFLDIDPEAKLRLGQFAAAAATSA